jgi:hypothetical protein
VVVTGHHGEAVALAILQLVDHVLPQRQTTIGIASRFDARQEGVEDPMGGDECRFAGVLLADLRGTPTGKRHRLPRGDHPLAVAFDQNLGMIMGSPVSCSLVPVVRAAENVNRRLSAGGFRAHERSLTLAGAGNREREFGSAVRAALAWASR